MQFPYDEHRFAEGQAVADLGVAVKAFVEQLRGSAGVVARGNGQVVELGELAQRHVTGQRKGTEHFAFGFGGILASGEQPVERSEEHTSELKALMRITYAVFCLKKQ